MDDEIRREATGFARNWWLFLITGLAWLLVGVLVLRFNITSVATVGILLGVMFLGAAFNESQPDIQAKYTQALKDAGRLK